MKRTILLASTVLATLGAAQTASACGEVSITEMNWASAGIVTGVSKFLMEQGYDCKVTVVPSNTVPAVASMAETGKPDIVTEMWTNSAPEYKNLEAEGKVKTVAKVLSDGGVEGWWIPDYLAAEHPELTTIEGVLAHPELVGGVFNNCPEGWGCRVANDNLKVAYDFAGHNMPVFDHGSGETLAASIASAYADKKPWFGYYWAPTAVLGKYPMVKVDVGPYNAEAHVCNQTVGCENPQKSDFPSAEVLTGVTAAFAEREPAIVELMSHVSFTNAQMGEVLAWQEDNKASIDESVVHFLTTYPEVWSAWVTPEAKEKLAAFVQ